MISLSSEAPRWIPPLNVTGEQVNDGLKIFGEALDAVVK
jgi:4-aminobutyrate aminotransferase-like enzyme